MPEESLNKIQILYFNRRKNKPSSKVVVLSPFLKILNPKKEVNWKLFSKMLANKLGLTILS
jgi:hypothetical protein